MDLTARARFHVAPGFDPTAPHTWVWEDRSADVNHNGWGITINGGRPDEVSEIEAGSANLQLDNAGGHYCTQNPLGRWYGRLAKGCPARWGTITGAEAFATDSVDSWGTPDVGDSWTLQGAASNWQVSGGVGQRLIPIANSAQAAILNGANARNGEATFVCYSAVIATGAPLIYGLQVRRTDNNNWLMFCVELSTSGSISAKIRRNTGTGFVTLSTNEPLAFTYSVNQRIKARCQFDGPNLRLRIWPEASAEPTTWTLTTTDNVVTAGSDIAMYLWRLAGNTNVGTTTHYVDDLEIEAVEIVGTVDEWPVEWDPTAAVSYAPIQIAGITRALSQGDEPLRSPIYRQLSAQPAMGYWPLEDGSQATSAASALTFAGPAALRSATAGNTDCPAGASSSVLLTTANSSSVSGTVTIWTIPQDGYAGMFYFKLPVLPGATSVRLAEWTAAGTITRWALSMNNATFTLDAYRADGSLSFTSGAYIFGSPDPTKWMAIQLEASESGGTVTWALIWNQVGTSGFLAPTGTYTGFADRLYSAMVIAPVDGTLVSHLWLGDDLLPFVDPVFIAVSAGYAGELAAARVARLCKEQGVQIAVEAGTSEALGVQRPGVLLDLLRSAEAADLGLLYEAGSGLGYRPRSARYNRPITMALAIGPTGDIGDPAPRPVDDDQRLRNYWTVARDGGSEATASDPVSAGLSRRRPDSATINVVDDSRLFDHASWRVHLGTVAEMRWPIITLDLTDRPTLLAGWRGRPHAPRISISGVPSQGPIGDLAHLVVEGWTQRITSHSWQVDVTCSPARPWDVGVYDDPVKRQDSSSTTTAAQYAVGVTSMVFSTVLAGDVWSTVSTPYDVIISGERITVTVMAAPSGTYPFTQTATVTRGVGAGGLTKVLPAGSEVHMHPDQLARYAL